jgi:hypothetical protein
VVNGYSAALAAGVLVAQGGFVLEILHFSNDGVTRADYIIQAVVCAAVAVYAAFACSRLHGGALLAALAVMQVIIFTGEAPWPEPSAGGDAIAVIATVLLLAVTVGAVVRATRGARARGAIAS